MEKTVCEDSRLPHYGLSGAAGNKQEIYKGQEDFVNQRLQEDLQENLRPDEKQKILRPHPYLPDDQGHTPMLALVKDAGDQDRKIESRKDVLK